LVDTQVPGGGGGRTRQLLKIPFDERDTLGVLLMCDPKENRNEIRDDTSQGFARQLKKKTNKNFSLGISTS